MNLEADLDVLSSSIIVPEQTIDTSPQIAPPPTGRKMRVIIASEENKPMHRFLSINGVNRYVKVDTEVILEEEFVRMLSECTRPVARRQRDIYGVEEVVTIAVKAHSFQVLGPA